MWQDHPRSQRLGPDIRGMRAASGCAVLAACGEEKLWLMFKLINNSVCDRGRSSCRLGWRGGDKPRCGYVHVVTRTYVPPPSPPHRIQPAIGNGLPKYNPLPFSFSTRTLNSCHLEFIRWREWNFTRGHGILESSFRRFPSFLICIR